MLPIESVEIAIFKYLQYKNLLRGLTIFDEWKDKKMSEIGFDAPSLNQDSEYRKKDVAYGIQKIFNRAGMKVKNPIDIIQDDEKTIDDLCKFCFEKQETMTKEDLQ